MVYILRVLINWIILTFSISLTSFLLPFISISGKTPMQSFRIALISGMLLGLINLAIKPIVKILSLPINILTLGLFNILINAGMLWLVAYFVSGLIIEGFWGYVISSILISIFSIILSQIFFREKK